MYARQQQALTITVNDRKRRKRTDIELEQILLAAATIGAAKHVNASI